MSWSSLSGCLRQWLPQRHPVATLHSTLTTADSRAPNETRPKPASSDRVHRLIKGQGGCCRYFARFRRSSPTIQSMARNEITKEEPSWETHPVRRGARDHRSRPDGLTGRDDGSTGVPVRQPGRSRSAPPGPAAMTPTTRSMNAAASDTRVGLAVLDQRGPWIGTVQRVHLNRTTERAEWVTVRAGRWVTTWHIAPLAGSTLGRRGLELPCDRRAVHHAPEVMDADQMDLGDQLALYSHYLHSVVASSQ